MAFVTLLYIHNLRTWDTVVSMVTRLWAAWSGIWIQARATDLCLPEYQNWLWHPPSLLLKGQKGLFLGVQQTRAWGCQLTSIQFQGQEWLELNLQSHMLSWITYWFKNSTFYNEALSVLHPTPKPTSYTQLLTHSHSPYFEAISRIHNLNMCHATMTHNALHNVSWWHS
jgi:hypothetical protein